MVKLHRHANSLKIGILFILSVATLYNFIQVRHLSSLPTMTLSAIEKIENELTSATLTIGQNTADNQQLSGLISSIEALSQQQFAAIQAELSQSTQTANHRIDAIDTKIEAHDSILQQLKESVRSLEAIKIPSAKVPLETPPAIKQKPPLNKSRSSLKPKLPFVLTGIELRGGNAVAVVAPNTFHQLAQLSHISIGQQSIDGWVLTHLSSRSATFQRGRQKITASLISQESSQ
ncbi:MULTISPECIES: hypothetical protein [unclassified Photorhabdus]|uniref:hypothetical protein n=1 Tax=unclassified Photorhabdus TaxID=2620880 RepID=UPI000DCF1ABC|nr:MULTISPECIES: hypothetical protein [unclassified Photorhabdus]RAW71945.1 hypothetical protein CKY15_08450 [Photorhabdus sp. S7-51]RAW73540.1 hypothetical protein CKY14_07765 [Photorhabdus sp. S14-60]RAW78474.1 hypothetical protein CKY06_07945 [Photorhabdus sp. S15-56]HEN3291946.1 hypothetical protein [Yersinia enterocolitica]